MRRRAMLVSASLTTAIAGCGGGATTPDAGPDAAAPDAGAIGDAWADDASRADEDAALAPSADAGAMDALSVDARSADASVEVGPPDAGCPAGARLCDATCTPEREACGVPLPEACTSSVDCGAAAECVSMRCVCAVGYRSCTAGCCPTTYSSVELEGLGVTELQLDHAPDATAYVLVELERAGVGDCELRLYERPVGGALVASGLTLPLRCSDDDNFDLAVRSDGVILVALATIRGEGTDIVLHEHRPGTAGTTVHELGTGYGYGPGVGLAIDAAGTAWVTWSRQRSGGMSGASLAIDGLLRTFSVSGSSGTVSQSDAEHDPLRGAVDSFWGHRYTGTFVSGVVRVDGAMARPPTCPADDAAYDTRGSLYTAYDSYSSIRTHFCFAAPGEAMIDVRASDALLAGATLPVVLGRFALAVDGEDTAFVSYYDAPTYTAGWVATRDGERFSRGVLPVRYGVPMGSTVAERAYTAAHARPDGRMEIVVAPHDATMGPMTLVSIE